MTREQAAAHRGKIVDVARTLFRAGFDGIGVADIMKGAGLKHALWWRLLPGRWSIR
jgi:TetR/AcrR family transcriptional repressor of nem operon